MKIQALCNDIATKPTMTTFSAILKLGVSRLISSPQLIVSGTVLVASIALLSPVASAGYWKVGHYKYQLDRSSFTIQRASNGKIARLQQYFNYDDNDMSSTKAPMDSVRKVIIDADDAPEGISNAGVVSLYNGKDVSLNVPNPGRAMITVTPYYEWISTALGDVPTPYFRTAEYAETFFSFGVVDGVNYAHSNAAVVGGYKLDDIGDGFNTPRETLGEIDPRNSYKTLGAKWHIRKIYSKGKHLVPGSSRTLFLNVSAPSGWTYPNTTEQFGAAVNYRLHYKASVIDLSLRVRPKGSNGDFSSSTTIAAGSKNSDIHKAEIQMIVSNGSGQGISGIPISILPNLSFKENTDTGKNKAAKFIAEFDVNATTDPNGAVVRGVVLSRDVTYSIHGPTTVEIEGIEEGQPEYRSVVIESTLFPKAPSFGPDDAEGNHIHVNYAPKGTWVPLDAEVGGGSILVDDGEVKDHNIDFVAVAVLLMEQDPDTGVIKKKFIIHPDHIDKYQYRNQNPFPTVDPDTGGTIVIADTANYVGFSPIPAVYGGSKLYKANIQLKAQPGNQSVVDAWILTRDLEVYWAVVPAP